MYKQYTIFFLLFLSTSSFATESTYSLGVGMYHETYREYDQANKIVMKQETVMTQLMGSYTYPFDDTHALNLGLRTAFGAEDYTGSLMGGTYGDLKLSEGTRLMFSPSVVYQYRLPDDLKNHVMSFGIGYRYLTDLGTYKGYETASRTSEYTYAILGWKWTHTFSNDWQITPNVQYNQFIHAQQTTHIFTAVKNRQRSGKGIELSMDISKRGWWGHITPVYRYWRVHASDAVVRPEKNGLTHYYEPTNRTHELGLQFSGSF